MPELREVVPWSLAAFTDCRKGGTQVNGISNSVMIAISETKGKLTGRKFENVTEALRAAFSETKDHLLIVSDDDRFRAGVGAVLLLDSTSAEDKQRITDEMNLLVRFAAALSAAQAGVPVDFAALLPGEPPKDSIGLMKLWDSRNEEKAKEGK